MISLPEFMQLPAIPASGGNRIVECRGDHIVCLPAAGYHLPLLYPPIRGRRLFKNGMLRNVQRPRWTWSKDHTS